ncbi:MAG: phenylalanine--tRNA ligase subunit beta [Nanoarchaeota archaeon]
MTILNIDKKQFEKKLGKIDSKIRNKIDMFGTPIDNESEKEISVEIFPNRPDLLSFYGFVRSFSAFCGKRIDNKYKAEKLEENYKIIIDKSVKSVRPFSSCAIVKGISFDDNTINEIINIQEKLHASYGRNRKKLAIGIYPLEEIKFPITFLAMKPEDIKFQPLDYPKEINGRQILNHHPTGREYAHLLKDYKIFPIFKDANNNILSMPPIINSEITGRISNKTKNIFIECSGFNKDYLDKTINIIVCALADIGGKIYQVEIEDIKDGNSLSPNLSFEKMELSIDYINKNLGLNLDLKEIINLLSRMGIEVVSNPKSGVNLVALIPPYRSDLLHKIDLVEEVAIAYGYENFKPEIPNISNIGEEDKLSIFKRKVAEILIGLGLIEISSYHLSTKEKQFKNIGIKEFKRNMIEVINSKNENNILRNSLFANSISVLSDNSDASYPQKVFELGRIFYHDSKSESGIGESERLCISLCDEEANFTVMKQILDYLMRMFNINYKIEDSETDYFIEGRCGKIIVNNKELGIIGEVSPFVLSNNKLKMPVVSMEIDLNFYPK